MTVDQLSQQIREFANYLEGLLTRLDQGAGWCAVFWQRDPDGMRACLGGRELPPWDVVESLLQDLANAYGPDVALQETERAGALHRAAVTAHDSRPGAREALVERFDAMVREQRTAAERRAELGRMLTAATTREQSDALRLDLAWASDDHERATARCAELRARLRDLDHRTGGDRADGARGAMPRRREMRGGGPGAAASPGSGATASPASGGSAVARRDAGAGAAQTGAGAQSGAIDWRAARRAAEGWWAAELDASETGAGQATGPAAVDRSHDFTASVPESAVPQPGTDAPAPDTADQRRRRRSGARTAGLPEQQTAPEAAAPAPAPPATGRAARGQRGARYAGTGAQPTVPAPGAVPQPEPAVPQPDPGVPETEDTRAVRETVAALVRLRGEGRTGEAHAQLVEAAYWPAARFPLLADLMERAGLTADWVTLLWEAASLPADLLVAAADALVEAGRAEDGQQMLRQGVARPAAEIGGAVLALVAEGRDREVRELLDAYVRVRTPEEAARSAEADPRRLAPLLLAAARAISDERHWDLLHALRVAGHTI
ncbi:hypothetical protein [Streptomyces sp. YIM S03343]